MEQTLADLKIKNAFDNNEIVEITKRLIKINKLVSWKTKEIICKSLIRQYCSMVAIWTLGIRMTKIGRCIGGSCCSLEEKNKSGVNGYLWKSSLISVWWLTRKLGNKEGFKEKTTVENEEKKIKEELSANGR